MSLNLDVVTDALRMLTVLDANETPSPEDGMLALRQMNDMFSFLAAEGVDLGYPPQDSLTEQFPMDTTVEAQIKPILAVFMSAAFATAAPPAIEAFASKARAQLVRDAVLASIEEADMSNLPRGEAHFRGTDITTLEQ